MPRKGHGAELVGAVAGSQRPDGYLSIGLLGRSYLAHRLAWFYVYGEWPENHIDHIDGRKSNNKISNLRKATASQNHQNKYKAASNSGLVGVSWCKREGRWRAYIKADGVMRSLGYHKTKEEARAAYLKAKQVLHPFATEGVMAAC